MLIYSNCQYLLCTTILFGELKPTVSEYRVSDTIHSTAYNIQNLCPDTTNKRYLQQTLAQLQGVIFSATLIDGFRREKLTPTEASAVKCMAYETLQS